MALLLSFDLVVPGYLLPPFVLTLVMKVRVATRVRDREQIGSHSHFVCVSLELLCRRQMIVEVVTAPMIWMVRNATVDDCFTDCVVIMKVRVSHNFESIWAWFGKTNQSLDASAIVVNFQPFKFRLVTLLRTQLRIVVRAIAGLAIF